MPLHSVDSLLSHLVLFKFHSVDVVKYFGQKQHRGGKRSSLWFEISSLWNIHVQCFRHLGSPCPQSRTERQEDSSMLPSCSLSPCAQLASLTFMSCKALLVKWYHHSEWGQLTVKPVPPQDIPTGQIYQDNFSAENYMTD